MSAYFLPYFEALWGHLSAQEDLDVGIREVGEGFDRLERRLAYAHPSWIWCSRPMLVDALGLPKESVQSVVAWTHAFLNRRSYRDLRGVASAWRVFVQKKLGKVHVFVHTATPLSTEMTEVVQEAVEARWGQAELTWVLNPELLGGITCYRDDQCWDLSIKSRIDRLALAFGIRGIV